LPIPPSVSARRTTSPSWHFLSSRLEIDKNSIGIFFDLAPCATVGFICYRLSKYLLRSGQRPPTGVRSLTRPYLSWVSQLHFTQIAQETTRQDYLHPHRSTRVDTVTPHQANALIEIKFPFPIQGSRENRLTGNPIGFVVANLRISQPAKTGNPKQYRHDDSGTSSGQLRPERRWSNP
jgi:hypothetical protein